MKLHITFSIEVPDGTRVSDFHQIVQEAKQLLLRGSWPHVGVVQVSREPRESGARAIQDASSPRIQTG
jgi:divalent metal cation (Fe/Co/Zn/Cd) transporter